VSVEVVYGPPGTGKTSTLLAMMAEAGDPTKIGFLAFTKNAAGEALRRLNLRTSKTVRTIHSLAYELTGTTRAQIVDHEKLKEFSEIIGYRVTGQSIIEAGELTFGDELHTAHQFRVAQCSDRQPDEVDRHFSITYTKWKKQNGYVDYNDLLLHMVDMDVNCDLDWLFLDEGQDLSELQWRAVEKIMEKTPNVVIAGDDDQAIYTWAGADAHGMARFNAPYRVLDQSHRIPRSVHEIAERIAQRMGDRIEKSYKPKDEDGTVTRYPSFDYLAPDLGSDTLVLYRNHSSRSEIEEWLLHHNVPYSITGLSGAFDDRYANAVRVYQALRRDEEISKAQQVCLAKAVHPSYRSEILGNDFSCIRRNSWEHLIPMPGDRIEYLRSVDLRSRPTFRVSTIHAAKGGEADHVILYNAMGSKTYENFDDNELRCWYVAVTRAKHKLTIIEGDNPMEL
jgi:superfamily I DNA/RNA helicase